MRDQLTCEEQHRRRRGHGRGLGAHAEHLRHEHPERSRPGHAACHTGSSVQPGRTLARLSCWATLDAHQKDEVAAVPSRTSFTSNCPVLNRPRQSRFSNRWEPRACLKATMKLHMPASRRDTSAEASAAAMASMDRQHAAEPPISSGRRPRRSISSNAAPTPTSYAVCKTKDHDARCFESTGLVRLHQCRLRETCAKWRAGASNCHRRTASIHAPC